MRFISPLMIAALVAFALVANVGAIDFSQCSSLALREVVIVVDGEMEIHQTRQWVEVTRERLKGRSSEALEFLFPDLPSGGGTDLQLAQPALERTGILRRAEEAMGLLSVFKDSGFRAELARRYRNHPNVLLDHPSVLRFARAFRTLADEHDGALYPRDILTLQRQLEGLSELQLRELSNYIRVAENYRASARVAFAEGQRGQRIWNSAMGRPLGLSRSASKSPMAFEKGDIILLDGVQGGGRVLGAIGSGGEHQAYSMREIATGRLFVLKLRVWDYGTKAQDTQSIRRAGLPVIEPIERGRHFYEVERYDYNGYEAMTGFVYRTRGALGIEAMIALYRRYLSGSTMLTDLKPGNIGIFEGPMQTTAKIADWVHVLDGPDTARNIYSKPADLKARLELELRQELEHLARGVWGDQRPGDRVRVIKLAYRFTTELGLSGEMKLYLEFLRARLDLRGEALPRFRPEEATSSNP